jgi:hypothetical protein
MKIILSLLASLLFAGQCFAAGNTLPLTGAGLSGSAASSYVGPGDAVSGALAFYSCQRAYNAAYANGSNAGCNIRRASDSHACDVLITPSGTWGNTGNCGTSGDNGLSPAAFCNATSCFVTQMYDQTGTGNPVAQATAGNQPALAFSCVGTSGCVQPGASATLTSANHLNVASGQTVSWVGERTSNTTTIMTAAACEGNANQTGFNSAANQTFIFATSSVLSQSANDNVWHAVQYGNTNAGATGSVNVDGTYTSGLSPGTHVCITGNSPGISVFSGNNNFSSGANYTEAIFYGSALSSANMTSLCRNQQAYYGSGNFGAAC